MIAEWDPVFLLTSPEGTLPFNEEVMLGTTHLGYYLLSHSQCQAGVAQRVTRTNLPQTDGEMTHRKFKTGYVMELNVQLWDTRDEPACGGVLRKMVEQLELHLNAIENADGRIQWQPSPWPAATGPTLDQRMLDRLRFLGPSGQGESGFTSMAMEQDAEGKLVVVTFALHSPLPYLMDVTEITTTITTTATLHNAGNALFKPVMRVHGPATSFSITNEDATDDFGTPLVLVYDSTLPGASAIPSGHYAEIDFFRETIYLDGNGANLKAGIDVTATDFFPLVPGDNLLAVGGGYGGTGIDVLWQSAYV